MNIKKVETKEKRQAVYYIRMTVFVDEQKVPEALEIDDFEETDINFISYEQNEPIAVSRLRLFTNYGKIERIAVKKEYRGQSIGSNIIRMMEDEIVAHHINEAILNAQTHATSFYESLGYEVFSEQFMDAGIPHV